MYSIPNNRIRVIVNKHLHKAKTTCRQVAKRLQNKRDECQSSTRLNDGSSASVGRIASIDSVPKQRLLLSYRVPPSLSWLSIIIPFADSRWISFYPMPGSRSIIRQKEKVQVTT